MFNKMLSKGSRWTREAMHHLSGRWSRVQGVTRRKHKPELIVSLTTIPERAIKVVCCIDSLLRQSVKPDRVILWVSESRGLNKSEMRTGAIAESLQRLEGRGLEIRWCEDIGSYRKLIPTMREHPDAIVVTADDDLMYPRHWLKALYGAYEKEPAYIHCHLAHLMLHGSNGALLPYRQWKFGAPGVGEARMDLFPTGGGGALYAPGHLDPEVLNESAFLSLSPRADDVWFKAMSLKRGVACKKVAADSISIPALKIPGNRSLFPENVAGGGNDRQIAAVNERYGVFGEIDQGR